MVIHEFGPPDVMKYETSPDPQPRFGEIRIRVHAATVNRVLDVAVRSGTQAHRKPMLPLILGFSGIDSTRTGGTAYRQSLPATLGGVAVPVVLGVAFAAVGVVASSAIAMLVLRVLRVRAGWRTTWSAFAYGLGPAAIMAVPYFGPICLSFPLAVWYLVVVAIVLVHALGIPGWKAACAAAAPAVLAMALGIASFLAAVAGSSSASVGATPAAPAGAAPSGEGEP